VPVGHAAAQRRFDLAGRDVVSAQSLGLELDDHPRLRNAVSNVEHAGEPVDVVGQLRVQPVHHRRVDRVALDRPADERGTRPVDDSQDGGLELGRQRRCELAQPCTHIGDHGVALARLELQPHASLCITGLGGDVTQPRCRQQRGLERLHDLRLDLCRVHARRDHAKLDPIDLDLGHGVARARVGRPAAHSVQRQRQREENRSSRHVRGR
jgi:hypothetical protein